MSDKLKQKLTPAAERALAEAAARRAEIDRKAAEQAKEAGGPEGPEPTRYGDWERKGIASDF
ncbi:MAG: succinate dehydrogenase assembly factor 4 [Pseudomonadota bacterium]